jgi:hypothetical protein
MWPDYHNTLAAAADSNDEILALQGNKQYPDFELVHEC